MATLFLIQEDLQKNFAQEKSCICVSVTHLFAAVRVRPCVKQTAPVTAKDLDLSCIYILVIYGIANKLSGLNVI